MNFIAKHKDEIIKLTIITVIAMVLSTIVYNIIMFIFNWLVINVPLFFSDSSSVFSDWWLGFSSWGEETVTFQKSKFQILSASVAIFTAFMQVVFWQTNKKYKTRN